MSAESFTCRDGGPVVDAVIRVIRENAAALSEIDGAIGDGDHGVNMGKGVTICAERLAGTQYDLSQGLHTLGTVLLGEIGGAMGPLYGTFFREMAKAGKGHETIDARLFAAMLERGLNGVVSLGGAKVGDKTLVDTLAPAQCALAQAVESGKPFPDALSAMVAAAEAGKESTRDLAARVGRSSRLGERSRGVLDAGAVSCCLILTAMARSMRELLGAGPAA
jgi:phosphoenolpyruvate---glycerone phosphotransferase subunit DhaL